MMDTNSILLLGIGIQEPWKITTQELDQAKVPNELHIHIKADRGSEYPCPECSLMCPAHDFKDFTWRHLNFFQHHCYIHASVPRIKCLEHGVKRATVPWSRRGSSFTLLFEQALLSFARAMPVLEVTRQVQISDKKIWSIIDFYVNKEKENIDLLNLKSIGIDETSYKKKHKYVSTAINMESDKEPVFFATEGRGSSVIAELKEFIESHNGDSNNIESFSCDMSSAFLKGIKENFPHSKITVDWFHMVKKFVEAVNKVRKIESKCKDFPSHVRWAVVKNAENNSLTKKQVSALIELEAGGFATSIAWRIKEKLSWIRKAETVRGAKWRITRFINYSRKLIGNRKNLAPMLKALESLERHASKVAERWHSGHTNARLEGLNSIFQAVRSRARGYRNPKTFLMMIYLIASPIASILKST